MSLTENLLIVCKYARGSSYAAEAQELAASAARFGYPVRTIEAADEGDWWRNCANKPRHLLEAFRQHDGPLLCLDADCRILQPLDEMLALLEHGDLAVKYRPDCCLSALFNAAVLLMRRTPATLGVVETWAQRGERFGCLHRFVEQGAFAEGMLYNQDWFHCVPLADKFHTMYDPTSGPPPADAVIVHLKASRRERKTALPAASRPAFESVDTDVAYVSLQPQTSGPAPGLPMAGVEGAVADFHEYASRFGLTRVAAATLPITARDPAALEPFKPAVLRTLCERFAPGTAVVVSDYDTVFLRDPGAFSDPLQRADVAVAWDHSQSDALPASSVIGIRAGAAVRDTLLPRLEQLMQTLRGGVPEHLLFRRALAEALRSLPAGLRVAALPAECAADLSGANRDTVALSVRGRPRAIQTPARWHMHAAPRGIAFELPTANGEGQFLS